MIAETYTLEDHALSLEQASSDGRKALTFLSVKPSNSSCETL